MIKIVKGDLLKAKEDVLIHQTNCYGVMGSGVAYQIKLTYPQVYSEYKELCNKTMAHRLLGDVQFSKIQADGKIIANLFGQLSFGIGLQTQYDALKLGFQKIKNTVKFKGKENQYLYGKTLAIPYNIGCGLGGGDWNIVYGIIEEVFNNPQDPCDITIYHLEK